MNATPSNLSYEFYYLLRTEIEQDDHTWLVEPDTTVQSPRITYEGITIDNDKRLFRVDAFITENQPAPLEQWPIYLKNGWEKIVPVTENNAIVFQPNDWLLKVVDTHDSGVARMPAPQLYGRRTHLF